MYHDPVMTAECLQGLNIKPGGVYVDATMGGGGHTKAILKEMDADSTLIAFDQDPAAQSNVPDDNRLLFVQQNFKYLKRFIQYHGFDKVDGILADLGVSSHQFDTAERGFSFRFDAPLDMRMSPGQPNTAADVVNTYSETDLLRIFSSYGEVHNAKTLVRHIAAERQVKPFDTTLDFTSRLQQVVNGPESQYFAKVFQALRIEVNRELDVLTDFLSQSIQVLRDGGRLVILSYHSLEDRLVKNFIKSGTPDGELVKDIFGHGFSPLKAINKKIIIPSEAEQKRNPRSRSARLRIAEKINA